MINIGEILCKESSANNSSTHLSHDVASINTSSYSPHAKTMSLEELIEVAQPLRGPNFDPESHILDWSDDSSDEEELAERTDEQILAELMQDAN